MKTVLAAAAALLLASSSFAQIFGRKRPEDQRAKSAQPAPAPAPAAPAAQAAPAAPAVDPAVAADTYKQYAQIYCGKDSVDDGCRQTFAEGYGQFIARWQDVCPPNGKRTEVNKPWLKEFGEDCRLVDTGYSELKTAEQWAELGKTVDLKQQVEREALRLNGYGTGFAKAKQMYATLEKGAFTKDEFVDLLKQRTKDVMPGGDRNQLRLANALYVYLGQAASDKLAGPDGKHGKVKFLDEVDRFGAEKLDQKYKDEYLNSDAQGQLAQDKKAREQMAKAAKDGGAAAKALRSDRDAVENVAGGRADIAAAGDAPAFAGANRGKIDELVREARLKPNAQSQMVDSAAANRNAPPAPDAPEKRRDTIPQSLVHGAGKLLGSIFARREGDETPEQKAAREKLAGAKQELKAADAKAHAQRDLGKADQDLIDARRELDRKLLQNKSPEDIAKARDKYARAQGRRDQLAAAAGASESASAPAAAPAPAPTPAAPQKAVVEAKPDAAAIEGVKPRLDAAVAKAKTAAGKAKAASDRAADDAKHGASMRADAQKAADASAQAEESVRKAEAAVNGLSLAIGPDALNNAVQLAETSANAAESAASEAEAAAERTKARRAAINAALKKKEASAAQLSAAPAIESANGVVGGSFQAKDGLVTEMKRGANGPILQVDTDARGGASLQLVSGEIKATADGKYVLTSGTVFRYRSFRGKQVTGRVPQDSDVAFAKDQLRDLDFMKADLRLEERRAVDDASPFDVHYTWGFERKDPKLGRIVEADWSNGALLKVTNADAAHYLEPRVLANGRSEYFAPAGSVVLMRVAGETDVQSMTAPAAGLRLGRTTQGAGVSQPLVPADAGRITPLDRR